MATGQRKSPIDISEIRCADDLAYLARDAVQQVRIYKEYRDLIGAILMANHIADWHFIVDLGRSKVDDSARAAMKARYPEWDILRQLANGTKHCKAQAKQEALQWEHTDFWSSPGHVGGNWLDWFVEFEGRQRSVLVLIESFLNKFSDQPSRPG